MSTLSRIVLPLVIMVLCFTSCEKDDPVIPNEEEVITTLVYTLTPVGGTDEIVFSFTDLDGDGGDDPVYTSGILMGGTTYNATLTLSNDQEFPSEDITAEISEEDDEHQFFFASTLSDLSFAYGDEDGDGNPVGLSSTVTAGEAGTGTLTITLRHEPNKSAAGVATGEIANAGGETDIEVTFNVSVF